MNPPDKIAHMACDIVFGKMQIPSKSHKRDDSRREEFDLIPLTPRINRQILK